MRIQNQKIGKINEKDLFELWSNRAQVRKSFWCRYSVHHPDEDSKSHLRNRDIQWRHFKFSRGNGREYVVMALLVAVLIATFTDFLSPGRDSELSAIGSRSGLIVLGSNAMVRKETFINSAQWHYSRVLDCELIVEFFVVKWIAQIWSGPNMNIVYWARAQCHDSEFHQ